MKVHKPSKFYRTAPLEEWTVADLTDALGLTESADVLNASMRTIYTIRHTGKVSIARQSALMAAVRANESAFRDRLVLIRARDEQRRPSK